jgi:hypothetical protein
LLLTKSSDSYDLITFIYWLVIERQFRGESVNPWSQVVGMFYGTYGNNMMFNGALWFLPCLFTVEIIFITIEKLKSEMKYIIVLGFIFIGAFLLQNDITFLPFGLTNALFFIGYYTIGFLLKSKVLLFEKVNKWLLSLIACVFFLLQIYWIKLDITIFTFMNDYGKDVIFAFLTIIMVFSLSMLLSQNKILEFLGKNSLVIFAFQEPTYRAVIYVFSKILNSDVEIVRNNIYYSFAIYITTILIIIPAIAIYNNKINPLLKKI